MDKLQFWLNYKYKKKNENKQDWMMEFWSWVSELNYFSTHLFNQFLSKGIWSFIISISLESTIPLYFPRYPSIKENTYFLINISTYSTLLNWGAGCSIALASFGPFFNFSLFLAFLSFLQLVAIDRKLYTASCRLVPKGLSFCC